jgi:hypothetical protein
MVPPTPRPRSRSILVVNLAALTALSMATLLSCEDDETTAPPIPPPPSEGQGIFRFDTFGNEPFWTDTLRMHEVIQNSVDPTTALAVGLKVDSDALPPGLLESADLGSPRTTVALLGLDAVLGLKATVVGDTQITRIGTTCALCHSTVDNSVMPGIGKRLDGWPNRDLNPGAILALSPALQDPAVQAVLLSWGPGKYDARWNRDGLNGPVVIPPAYGLLGVDLATWTGEGSIPYWNAYVAVTQMHGQGTFVDPRIGVDIRHSPDLVTPKLPALHLYQLELEAPAPPPGSYDTAAAERGKATFEGKARCASCHIPPIFTDAGFGLHLPTETGSDPFLATRSTTGRYRTPPLRGIWQHPPYFHDGSSSTLLNVVNRYNSVLGLSLTDEQKQDLVEYLKSL